MGPRVSWRSVTWGVWTLRGVCGHTGVEVKTARGHARDPSLPRVVCSTHIPAVSGSQPSSQKHWPTLPRPSGCRPQGCLVQGHPRGGTSKQALWFRELPSAEAVCGLRTQVCSGVVHAGERAAPRTEAQCLGVQGAGGRQTKPSSAVLIRQHLTDLGTFVQPLKSSVSENLGYVTNTAHR